MVVKRGEIWWASLGHPVASEPGFCRPILVVQADSFNRSKISTVLAAVITSNLLLAEAPGNVRLSKRESKLRRESVVNVSQVVTLDKSFLTERVGHLSSTKQQEVDDGLRLVFSL